MIETNENLALNLDMFTKEYEFYEEVVEQDLSTAVFSDRLLTFAFSLHDQEVYHERQVFTIVDLLGNIGGILDIFLIITKFLISPYASLSFMNTFISKLYKLKTKNLNKQPDSKIQVSKKDRKKESSL